MINRSLCFFYLLSDAGSHCLLFLTLFSNFFSGVPVPTPNNALAAENNVSVRQLPGTSMFNFQINIIMKGVCPYIPQDVFKPTYAPEIYEIYMYIHKY